MLRAISALAFVVGARHAIQPQANARQRRAQLVGAIGDQQLVRAHQLFDALGRFIEAFRERRDFIATFHLHARREIAGAELQHARLQSREARGDATRDRIGQQRKRRARWTDRRTPMCRPCQR